MSKSPKKHFSMYSKAVKLFLLLVLPASLLAFGGKPPDIETEKRVVGKDKSFRTLSFVQMQNLSPGTNDFLAQEIPENIASSLATYSTIHLPYDKYLPETPHQSLYTVKRFTNSLKAQVKPNEKISNTNQVSTNSNTTLSLENTNDFSLTDTLDGIFPSFIPTQTSNGELISYIVSNYLKEEKKWEYHAYYEKSNTIYIDAYGAFFEPSDLEENEFIWTNHYLDELPPVIILSEESGNERSLNVEKNLYKSKRFQFKQLYQDVPGDFIVFGRYRAIGEETTFLQIFLLEPHRRSFRLISEMTLDNESLLEVIPSLGHLVLSAIQDFGQVEKLEFISSPPGAYIYIGQQYLGTAPFTMNYHPEGQFDFEVWHPAGALDISNSTAFSNKSIFPNTSTIVLSSNEQQKEFHFEFNKDSLDAFFEIKLKGNQQYKFYLNNQLVLANSNYSLTPEKDGKHFLSVHYPGLEPQIIKIELAEGQKTTLFFDTREERPFYLTRKILLDHHRNYKSTEAIGFTLGLGYTATLRWLNRYEDKYKLAATKGYPIASDYEDKYRDLDQVNEQIGYTALGFLSASLVSYVFFIRDQVVFLRSENGKDWGVYIRQTAYTTESGDEHGLLQPEKE